MGGGPSSDIALVGPFGGLPVPPASLRTVSVLSHTARETGPGHPKARRPGWGSSWLFRSFLLGVTILAGGGQGLEQGGTVGMQLGSHETPWPLPTALRLLPGNLAPFEQGALRLPVTLGPPKSVTERVASRCAGPDKATREGSSVCAGRRAGLGPI